MLVPRARAKKKKRARSVQHPVYNTAAHGYREGGVEKDKITGWKRRTARASQPASQQGHPSVAPSGAKREREWGSRWEPRLHKAPDSRPAKLVASRQPRRAHLVIFFFFFRILPSFLVADPAQAAEKNFTCCVYQRAVCVRTDAWTMREFSDYRVIRGVSGRLLPGCWEELQAGPGRFGLVSCWTVVVVLVFFLIFFFTSRGGVREGCACAVCEFCRTRGLLRSMPCARSRWNSALLVREFLFHSVSFEFWNFFFFLFVILYN